MRRFLKIIYTLLIHPIISINLILHGNRFFVINKRCKINNIKYVKFGKNFSIGTDSRFLLVDSYCSKTYAPSLIIKDNVTCGNRVSFLCATNTTIESNCLIASDVIFTNENHGMNPELSDSYASTPLETKEIHIGEGCWIGEKSTILPGVSLGKRCIVAAGSVVTKSFGDYILLGGIPAKPMKYYDFECHEWRKYNYEK